MQIFFTAHEEHLEHYSIVAQILDAVNLLQARQALACFTGIPYRSTAHTDSLCRAGEGCPMHGFCQVGLLKMTAAVSDGYDLGHSSQTDTALRHNIIEMTSSVSWSHKDFAPHDGYDSLSSQKQTLSCINARFSAFYMALESPWSQTSMLSTCH